MNHRFAERPAMWRSSRLWLGAVRPVSALILIAPGLMLAALPAHAAQLDDTSVPTTVSRPVVQSAEVSGTRELDSALSRLARDPRNPSALIDAGNAALRIGDTEAALGFFSRADEVAPGNGRVKAQIASALLQGENPFDAIRYFDDAERAGADKTAMAGDRGLAYDLIGDNTTAQRWYQLALSRGVNDEVTRRYALSLAIAGDRRGAEALLSPQVQRQDRAAWRVRTFIMAITGNQDEAVSIAYASMPQDLAAGISPYLRYMPRLTLAQQAAAANFGHFPRAADIGRDDARVVQYAALHPRPARAAAAGLIPAGEAMGGNGRGDKPSRDKRRRPGQVDDNTRIAAATPAPAVAAALIPPPPPPPPPRAVVPSAPVRLVQATPAPAPVRTAVPVADGTASRPVAAPVFSILDRPPSPRPALVSRAGVTASPVVAPVPMVTPAPVRVAAAPLPAPVPAPVPVPAPAPTSVSAGFDLARVQGSTPIVQATPTAALAPAAVPAAVALAQAPLPVPAVAAPVALVQATPPASQVQPLPSAPEPAPASAPAPSAPAPAVAPPSAMDFAALFNGFRPPEEEQQRKVAAVDLARIKPGRPKLPEPKVAEPKVAVSVKSEPRDARDAKGKMRGERPDGPTSVSRIEERAGLAIRDAKTGKDAKGKGAKAATPTHPSRIWVQVLTGGNKGLLDDEWRRMARQGAEAFRGRKPYVTPWRSNFRLLTGPFESDAAAQAFLNQLTRARIGGFQWTSPAGQAIDTLPLK